MDPRLLTHYEQELRYFRESAGEFAQEFPKIAARLGIANQEVADPYVERLIEATAFLSARVSVKLDAVFPRFTNHLLDIVYPQYLAPTPAMAIAEIFPNLDDANLAQGLPLPRGSTLRARQPVGQDTRCEFRTGHALKLWPLRITDVQYFSFAPDLPLARLPYARRIQGGLRVRLQSTAGLTLAQLPIDQLDFHLGGASDIAWMLYEFMNGNPLGILVRPINGGKTGAAAAKDFHATLPVDNLIPLGFDDAEALLPVTHAGFSGYRLLQEYFAFAHRFQCMRLLDLQAVLRKAAFRECDEIEIVFLFSRGNADLEKLVSAEHLRLHCVPLINLFEKRLDRVPVNDSSAAYHLVAERTKPQDFEIHTITQVVGYGSAGQAETQFKPFFVAFHDERSRQAAYYSVSREPRLLSTRQKQQGNRSSYIGSEVYLSLVDPQHAPFKQSISQLAAQALCSNRDLPLLLPLGGQNDFELAGSQPINGIRAIRGPSRPFTLVAQNGLPWRLIDHLSLNYLSLADADDRQAAAALREMLGLYAVPGDNAGQTQIQGLTRVSCQPVVRRLPLPGPLAFGRGVEVTLEVDEQAFHGHSAFLFGAVMARFLARHVSANSFVETVLRSGNGHEIMRWKPRCGTKAIL